MLAKNGFDHARRLHRRALGGLQVALAAKDRDGVRQAAEKGWLATVEATKALLKARGIFVPGGTGRQRDALLHLRQTDRRSRALLPLFALARETLHVSCFYDDDVRPMTVEAVLGDVGEFIEAAERAASRR